MISTQALADEVIEGFLKEHLWGMRTKSQETRVQNCVIELRSWELSAVLIHSKMSYALKSLHTGADFLNQNVRVQNCVIELRSWELSAVLIHSEMNYALKSLHTGADFLNQKTFITNRCSITWYSQKAYIFPLNIWSSSYEIACQFMYSLRG
jgi:hypothetical protein